MFFPLAPGNGFNGLEKHRKFKDFKVSSIILLIYGVSKVQVTYVILIPRYPFCSLSNFFFKKKHFSLTFSFKNNKYSFKKNVTFIIFQSCLFFFFWSNFFPKKKKKNIVTSHFPMKTIKLTFIFLVKK